MDRPAAFIIARRRLLAGTAMLLALTVAGGVTRAAAPSGEAAERVVRQLVERVWQLVSEHGADDGRYHELLLVIDQQTDLSLLGRLALGRHWRSATPEQQAEYLTLFRNVMLRRFVERLRPYAGSDLGRAEEGFRIVASRPVGPQDILVQSQVMPPSSPPLQVDWRLRQQEDHLVIIDLIVGGISLLLTQRSEFSAVLERVGMEGLLVELRARAAQPI
jgi:phospholipid transport system substrate-binding protein